MLLSDIKIDMDSNAQTKKKRGRKPKHLDESFQNKKRGRKPTNKIIDVNELTYDNTTNIDTNCIAFLPITEDDIKKFKGLSSCNENIIIDRPDSTTFFHDIEKNMSSNKQCFSCETNKAKIDSLQQSLNELISKLRLNKKVSLHNLDINVCYNDTIPNKVACWWCCHTFDWDPIGMPEKMYNDTLYISGCFCSLNCVMAYNFDLNDNKVWERVSLINFIKNKIYGPNSHDITPSPPRQILNLFGGPMSIDEFRKANMIMTKEYKLLMPPTICISLYIEERNK